MQTTDIIIILVAAEVINNKNKFPHYIQGEDLDNTINDKNVRVFR